MRIWVLFMCVANSARSQLAEGIAKALFQDKADIQSAGSNPSHVNPFAIKVLNEIQIDISHHRSKTVDALDANFVKHLDYVITLCAEEVCPVMISKAKKLHWPLPDPAREGSDEVLLQRFRDTRDEIFKRVQELKNQLVLQSWAIPPKN